MRRIAIGALLALSVLVVTAPAWASAQSEITAATSQGKAVFLVVTQANARGTDRAIQIASQAKASRRTPRSWSWTEARPRTRRWSSASASSARRFRSSSSWRRTAWSPGAPF